MSRKYSMLTERDVKIFTLIWKYKLVSTALVCARYFGPRYNVRAAYQRLERLNKLGFLDLIYVPSRRFYWTLNKKSFECIRRFLPDETEFGFKPEHPAHDAIVAAVQTATWTKEPEGVKTFTQQQLERYPIKQFPDWVPKTKIRIPDGYWYLPKNGGTTIALEVELNQKSDEDYELLAAFYNRHMQVARVIWVVPSDRFAHNLQRKFEKEVGPRAEIHHFVLLADVIDRGLEALRFFCPEGNKNLSTLIEGGLLKLPVNFQRLLNLDGRKCPYNLSILDMSVRANYSNSLCYPEIVN